MTHNITDTMEMLADFDTRRWRTLESHTLASECESLARARLARSIVSICLNPKEFIVNKYNYSNAMYSTILFMGH